MERNSEGANVNDLKQESPYLLDRNEQILSSRWPGPMPPELCGFYVQRLLDGRYCFGRPKNRVIHWEIAELVDLLDLGVNFHDLERLAPGRGYRVQPTAVVLHARD